MNVKSEILKFSVAHRKMYVRAPRPESRRPQRAAAVVALRRIDVALRPSSGRRGREQYEEDHDVVFDSDSSDSADAADDAATDTATDERDASAPPAAAADEEEEYEQDGFVVPDAEEIVWAEDANERDRAAHAAHMRDSRDDVQDALDELHATHLRIQMSDEQAFRMLFEAQARRALSLPLTDDLLAAEADPLSRPCTMRDSWRQFADSVLRSELWSPALLEQQRERFTSGDPYPCVRALRDCDGKHESCSMCGRRHAAYYHAYLMAPDIKTSSVEWVAGARCHRRAEYYRRFYRLHKGMQARALRMEGWAGKPKGEALLAELMAEGGECDAYFKYLNDLMRDSALFVEEYINKQ